MKLDLHAKRFEEALEEVALFLDQAVFKGVPEVCIVHGHGAGTLKKGVREYLTASPYVAHFRAGESWEGGDGVTIVTLMA